MSDDSFIREVDEELRSDKMQDFWKRYGKILIGGAIAVVLVTAGSRYYEYYTNQKAAEAGDAFISAVQLAEQGKHDEALTTLVELESNDSPAYKAMALMRGASELAAKGDVDEAIKKYDAVAANADADDTIKAIANLRAGLLLVDSGTVAQVEARVGPLSAPGAPFRASAREAIGLAHFKAGDLENAFKQYESLSKDVETPRALGQRVRIMLDLIASRGGPQIKP